MEVRRAVQVTDPLEKEIVRLRTVEGLTHRKIAARLTTPQKEITRHLVRHVLDRVLGKSAPRTRTAVPLRHMVQASKKWDWGEVAERLREELLEDIRAEARERPVSPRLIQAPPTSGILREVSPVDLHVGKLAWGEETGNADYDIRIAEQVFTAAIDELIARTRPLNPELSVLVVGNDLLQTDNLQGTTTSGTYVDTDTRYIKSFRRARKINSWAIRRLAESSPVHVVIVPGNHDRLTAFHLGEVLEAEFKDDPNVVVDNAPTLRKYLRWGSSLLGWTHGSDEKAADLPLIMATERPLDWAESIHREWHVGHLHKAKETRYTAGDSFNGVRVRILPSLCAPDAWHVQRGYVGERRAAECYLWQKDTGYWGHYSSNVPEEAQAA